MMKITVTLPMILAAVYCCLCCSTLAKGNKNYPKKKELEASFRALDDWILKAEQKKPKMQTVYYYEAACKANKLFNSKLQPALNFLSKLINSNGKCDEPTLESMSEFVNLNHSKNYYWTFSRVAKIFLYYLRNFEGSQCDEFFQAQYTGLGIISRPNNLDSIITLGDYQRFYPGKSALDQAILDWRSKPWFRPSLEDLKKLASGDPRIEEFLSPKFRRFIYEVKELTPDEKKSKDLLDTLFKEYLYEPCKPFTKQVGTLFGAFTAYFMASPEWPSRLAQITENFKLDFYQYLMCSDILDIYENEFDDYFRGIFFLKDLLGIRRLRYVAAS